MILRISHKLNATIKAGPLSPQPLSENPFADWSAHPFLVGRTSYILLSNTKSLYSTVMPSKGIKDGQCFVERALGSLREFLEADGQASVYRRFIVPASDPVQFAKALNRVVTGSMNELIADARYLLAEGERSRFDVGRTLNEVLLSALATSRSEKYGTPRDSFQAMASGFELEP